MEKKEFIVTIDAPKEKVWNTLWNDATYPQWTAVFAPGSRAETDWQKGSKGLFLDGKNSGMVSTIAEKKPNEFMSFKHLGMVIDGVEDVDSDKVKGWSGATENYTLQTVNGKTELRVDLDVDGLDEKMLECFSATFPKALETLKELAEKN